MTTTKEGYDHVDIARRAFQAGGREIQKRGCAWLSTESAEPRVPVAGPSGAGETAPMKLNR